MTSFKPVFSSIAAVILLGGIIFAFAFGAFGLPESRASSGVDVAIVIALDVSASVDEGEFELMRDGLAAAVSSPQVIKAMVSGKHGAVALNVVQWSGFTEQQVMIGWSRLSSSEELVEFAGRVRQMARRYKGGATDIGGAINFSREQVEEMPFTATRTVIDIAGDGPNNVNFSPARERDRATKQGITINGLAVVGDVPVLVRYFHEFIIGGPDAFVEKAADYDGFERAMRRKLVREIGAMFLF